MNKSPFFILVSDKLLANSADTLSNGWIPKYIYGNTHKQNRLTTSMEGERDSICISYLIYRNLIDIYQLVITNSSFQTLT
jgi:hypothetical protein